MSRPLRGRRGRAAAGALVLALLLAGCAAAGGREGPTTSGIPTVSAGSLAEQTIERDGVEIVASGRSSEGAVTVDLQLTRHDGDLANDLSSSVLTVGDATLTRPVWKGDPASGHHRTGQLVFAGPVASQRATVLTLSGWADPVVLRWSSTGQPESST